MKKKTKKIYWAVPAIIIVVLFVVGGYGIWRLIIYDDISESAEAVACLLTIAEENCPTSSSVVIVTDYVDGLTGDYYCDNIHELFTTEEFNSCGEYFPEVYE